MSADLLVNMGFKQALCPKRTIHFCYLLLLCTVLISRQTATSKWSPQTEHLQATVQKTTQLTRWPERSLIEIWPKPQHKVTFPCSHVKWLKSLHRCLEWWCQYTHCWNVPERRETGKQFDTPTGTAKMPQAKTPSDICLANSVIISGYRSPGPLHGHRSLLHTHLGVGWARKRWKDGDALVHRTYFWSMSSIERQFWSAGDSKGLILA